MLYVGVDAHKATSQITVINETGSILKRAKVASNSVAFQQANENSFAQLVRFNDHEDYRAVFRHS